MKKGEVYLSTNIFPFHKLDEENLYFVKRCGFDSIEIWGMKPHFDYENEGSIKNLKRILNKVGLKVSSLHLPFYERVTLEPEGRGKFYISDGDEILRKKALKETLNSLRMGRELGGEVMVLHTGMEGPNSSTSALLKSLEELILKAERFDVKIALENGYRKMTTLRELLPLLDEFKTERLGLCIDFGHINIAKEWETLKRVPPDKIFEVHIADNDGERDEHLIPFTGNMPWERAYEILWKIKGEIVLEVGPVKPHGNLKKEILLSGKSAGKISSAINIGERGYKEIKAKAEISLFEFGRKIMKDFIPLKGDASIRRYFRIITEEGERFVLMDIPLNSNLEEKLETQQPQRMVDSFLNIHKFLHKEKIKVPPIEIEDPKRKVFFLKDCGDTLLEDLLLLSEKEVESAYRKSIDLLLRLQGLKNGECIAFTRSFDEKTFLWEIDHFFEYGLKGINSSPPLAVREELYSLSKTLSHIKGVFCHRDYHSKNIIIDGEETYIVDFQDALKAPPHYDIASLVFDSYADFHEEFEEMLINIYYEKAREILKEDKSDFLKNLYMTGLHRNLKAFGRFIFINEEKGNPYFLRFLSPTIKKAIRNAKRCGLKETEALLLKIEEKL